MYKVFFNDSSISLCSEFENSFKDNNFQIVEFKGDIDFVSWIEKLEKELCAKNLVFIHSNINQLWADFRKQFIEISAAGGIVSDKKGNILVIKRFGYWDLPKGKVEKKETLEEAAIREVEEECGISGVQIGSKICSMFHMYRSPYHQAPMNIILKETTWFAMTYKGMEVPIPECNEGIEEVKWMKIDDLGSFYKNTYSNLVELVKNYLAVKAESNLS